MNTTTNETELAALQSELKRPTASAMDVALLVLLLERINAVRRKCPGIGGDVDAMNVRWMIEHGEWHESTVAQAARTLGSLAPTLGISTDVIAAIEQRRALVSTLAGCAAALREAGKDFARANRHAMRPNLYETHAAKAEAVLKLVKQGGVK